MFSHVFLLLARGVAGGVMVAPLLGGGINGAGLLVSDGLLPFSSSLG